MSELVDRIMQVIDEIRDDCDCFPTKRIAVAIVEALREPTDRMVEAVMNDRDKRWCGSDDPQTFRDDWAVAIDAALQD
jgi:hypothetical protein